MSLFDQIGNRQPPQNFQDALSRLQRDPQSAITEAHVNIPKEKMGDPQAMVMHLIQSGQVGGPVMRMISPMIQRLTGK